jgi:hypothetical protein
MERTMDHQGPPALTAQDLKLLATADPAQCTCALKSCTGWDSVSNDRWPAQQLPLVGTLRRPLPDGVTEPTFEEFHPHGTRYESAQAPIAPAYFPFNRCDVHACQQCGCAVLKYTEFGGYYVDPRARLVARHLVVDVSAP